LFYFDATITSIFLQYKNQLIQCFTVSYLCS